MSQRKNRHQRRPKYFNELDDNGNQVDDPHAQSYPDDIEACYVEQVNIDKELSSLFNNAKRQVDNYKNTADKTGKSTERDIIYVLNDGGEVGIACLDYGKKWTRFFVWKFC